MRRAELVMAVALAAFSGYLMWKSAELEIGWIAERGPGPGAFPFWLGAGMLACCAWIILRWLRGAAPQARRSPLPVRRQRPRLRSQHHQRRQPFQSAYPFQLAKIKGIKIGQIGKYERPAKVEPGCHKQPAP